MKTATKVGLGIAAFLLPGALLLAAFGYAVYYVKKKSDAKLPSGEGASSGSLPAEGFSTQARLAGRAEGDGRPQAANSLFMPPAAAPPTPPPPPPAGFAARNMLAPELQRRASAAKAASLLADELPFSAISSFVLPKGTYSWSDGATFNAKKLTLTNHSGHSVQMKTPKGPFTLENDTQYALALDSALHVPNPN